MIRQYTYCPMKIYWRYIIGLHPLQTPQIKRGLKTHQKIWYGRKIVKRGKTRKIIERKYYVYDPKTNIAGTIDLLIKIIRNNETIEEIPVEVKTGAKKPQKQHIIQIATYILILKNTGHKTNRGILYYTDTKKKHIIKLDEKLEKQIIQTRDKIIKILKTQEEPQKTKQKWKCQPCEYNKFCNPT